MLLPGHTPSSNRIASLLTKHHKSGRQELPVLFKRKKKKTVRSCRCGRVSFLGYFSFRVNRHNLPKNQHCTSKGKRQAVYNSKFQFLGTYTALTTMFRLFSALYNSYLNLTKSQLSVIFCLLYADVSSCQPIGKVYSDGGFGLSLILHRIQRTTQNSKIRKEDRETLML